MGRSDGPRMVRLGSPPSIGRLDATLPHRLGPAMARGYATGGLLELDICDLQ